MQSESHFKLLKFIYFSSYSLVTSPQSCRAFSVVLSASLRCGVSALTPSLGLHQVAT